MFASGVDIVPRLVAIGGGVVLLFIGVALFSSLPRPSAGGPSWAAPRQGSRVPAGRLARDNAVRNPSRTAVTAAALMIGIALVTFVAVLGQGLRASFGGSPSRTRSTTDYVLTADDTFSPFAPEAGDSAAARPGRDGRSPPSARTRSRPSATRSASTASSRRRSRLVLRLQLGSGLGRRAGAARHRPERSSAAHSRTTTSLRVGDSFLGARARRDAADAHRAGHRQAGKSFDPLGLGEIFCSPPALFDCNVPDRAVTAFVFFHTPGRARRSRTSNAALQRCSPRRSSSTRGGVPARTRKIADQRVPQPPLRAARALGDRRASSGSSTRSPCRSWSARAGSECCAQIGMNRRQMRRMVRHERDHRVADRRGARLVRRDLHSRR